MGEFWRTSSGCAGPNDGARFELEMPDGTTQTINECPHRILRRAEDPGAIYRAIRWFLGYCNSGVLPCSGGYFEQAAGFDECVATMTFARAKALEATAPKGGDNGRDS